MEPLVIAFVWNIEDDSEVKNYVNYITNLLTRDLDKPYSRNINLPLFYYTNSKNSEVPSKINLKAEKIIIFVFIGTNVVASDNWEAYVRSLYTIKNSCVIPIALDKNAYKIDSDVKEHNFIRVYEFEECKKQILSLYMTHEIYRNGLNYDSDINKDEYAPLKIFLSHCKDKDEGNGLILAKKLKEFIDNTTMKSFFDANSILPGDIFDDTIKKNIQRSSMIIINSDSYSNSFWCQREVEYAKQYKRPIIEVDVLSNGVDRKLPYAGNIPVIRIEIENKEVKKEDLFHILELALVETIRYNYEKVYLEKFKKQFSMEEIKVLCRPPEAIDLEDMLMKDQNGDVVLKYNEILYPDPPLHEEELQMFIDLGIKTYTPIEAPFDRDCFKGMNIGISISEAEQEEIKKYGQNEEHLKKVSQSVANYILGHGATLIYGGDLRDNGYTQQLIAEASAMQSRSQSPTIYLKDYIAWPIYLNDTSKVKEWKAKNKEILKIEEVKPDEDVVDYVENIDSFIKPDTLEHRFAWSKSLTEMRRIMISKCDARVCAGGRKTGFRGRMPGVLEEILIAVEDRCPLYLLGGFGGITHSICNMIKSGSIPRELTVEWQIMNNEGYVDLLDKYESINEPIEYNMICETIIDQIQTNGLTKEENEELFNTPYADEAVQLVLKGLKNLNK